MIKYISIIFLILICQLGYSQEKDTADIIFKAKLLTLDRHGVSDKAKLLEDILKQKLEIIEYSDSSNWIFMKIKFDQKYGGYIDKHSVLWLGNCYFYLAFRKEKSKFYRLGGFDSLDLDDFVNDIQNDIEYFKILSNEKLNNDIPVNCIESYVELSKRKRLKKGYNCFQKCSDILTTTLIVH